MARAKRAIRPPEALANAPVVELGLELYYRAFWDLATDRRSERSRISWSTIRRYCRELELDEWQTEWLHFLVERMDMEFLALTAPKDKGGRAGKDGEARADARRVRRQDARPGRQGRA